LLRRTWSRRGTKHAGQVARESSRLLRKERGALLAWLALVSLAAALYASRRSRSLVARPQTPYR